MIHAFLSHSSNWKSKTIANIFLELCFIVDAIKHSNTSLEFIDIVQRCFCFIAPSCSESISTAVATLLQVGLYPIISKNTGIDLPEHCGIYLDSLSIYSIESAVNVVNKLNNLSLIKQINKIQKMTLDKYSRDAFYVSIKNFIQKSIAELK